MRITSALLCDAATVREGLLHVLGGGITRFWQPELPGPLQVVLAALVGMEREVESDPHAVTITITHADGALVSQATATLQYNGGSRLEPGEEHSVPLVVPLHEVVVTQFGRHEIAIAIDGAPAWTLQLWVLHPDERVLPPL